jgi:hypothetical protein
MAVMIREDIVRLREDALRTGDSETVRLSGLALRQGPGSGPWEEVSAILRDSQYEVADVVTVRNLESGA